MTTRLTLRTADQALAYLASIGHYVTVVDGHVVQRRSCGRCGGSGIYSAYHGACYGCYGNRPTWTAKTPLVEYAKGVRKAELAKARKAVKAVERREAAEQRKLDGQRRWCEAQGHGAITFAELDAQRASALAAEVAAEAATKAHVGVVGERVKLELTLEKMVTLGAYDRLRYLHVFADQSGNRVVYWGNAVLYVPCIGGPAPMSAVTLTAMPPGYRCTLTAKVHGHGHYAPKAVRGHLGTANAATPGIPETVVKNPRAVKPTDDYVWQVVSERLGAE